MLDIGTIILVLLVGIAFGYWEKDNNNRSDSRVIAILTVTLFAALTVYVFTRGGT